MKNLLSIILLLLTISVVNAGDIKVSVQPNPVIAGEPAQFVMTVGGGNIPTGQPAFPLMNNIQWLNGSSRQSYQINGSITSTVAYSFIATETGSYKIPAFKVNIAGSSKSTSPVSFKVIGAETVKTTAADGVKRPLKDMLFAKAVILSEGRDFYVGEEVPIEIRLYLMRGLNANPTAWPKFNVENIIFRNYKNNQQDKRFAQPLQSSENINGRIFNVLKFRTAFRAIVAGKMSLTARIKCEVQVPDQRRRRSRSWFDDDFFGRRSRRRFNQTVNASFPTINIKSLPPVPDTALSLGLVGNWYVDFSVIGDEFKVGEPFTLKMEIKGMGTLETLTAPRLKIPGFRIYRPEVDKGLVTTVGSSKAVVKYVIIPTEPGKKMLDVAFSVFLCPKEKYEIFRCDRQLEIAKSDNPSVTNGGVYLDTNSQGDESYTPKVKKNRPAPGLHYQKSAASGELELPLYLNYLWLYIVLGLGGPLLLLLVELRHRHRQKLISDPLLQRKLQAQSGRGKVIKAINSATSDDLDNAINQVAVPYLNALLGLPPGTTASALADKVKSPELAKCLKSTGHSSYMPGGDIMNKSELKKTLLKALRKMSVIALFLLLSLNSFATDNKANKLIKLPLSISSNSQALTAYDNGEFRLTAEYYYKQLAHQTSDPALLYNLGNCFSRMEDYPRAAVCYERARLLNPDDNDILENLNYVRRKLFLPQLGTTSNPVELILHVRNQLRPDQWLALAGAVWFVIFVAIALRRYYSRAKLISMMLGYCLILALFVTAAISQYCSSYSDERAIIISKMVKMYSLPSIKNAREISRVGGGASVEVLERRINWVYIRHDNCEGWVNVNELATIAPGAKLFKLPWEK